MDFLSTILLWQSFLAQGVYRLQYISTRPRHCMSMVIILRSYLYVLNYLAGPVACSIFYVQLYSYYFHLKLWSSYIAIYSQLLVYTLIDLSLNARTIHKLTPTVASYSLNISSCNCSESVLLLIRVLYWMQQVNIREILWPHQASSASNNP